MWTSAKSAIYALLSSFALNLTEMASRTNEGPLIIPPRFAVLVKCPLPLTLIVGKSCRTEGFNEDSRSEMGQKFSSPHSQVVGRKGGHSGKRGSRAVAGRRQIGDAD